jgi:pimeloyl-ACP methyl ester carboxylesterase
MTTSGPPFVLVHGAWHGAWCWERVVPLLRAAGRSAVALDLPAHGADRTPAAGVTLDAYVDTVLAALDARREPVALVGHSMGGTVISQAAERRPDRIARLVYLCAFLLRDGESLLDLATQDSESLLRTGLRFDPAAGVATLEPGVAAEAFYHDCPPAEAAAAGRRLVPNPMLPLATPLALTAARFGRVPRVYVECLRDRAVGLDLQRRMHGALPCRTVRALDTGHSPFYAAPRALVDMLLQVA